MSVEQKANNILASQPVAASAIINTGEKVTNAAQTGQLFRANHLEPGLVRYDEFVNPVTGVKGMTLLVEREAIEAMRPSFMGRPVYKIEHPRTKVTPQDVPTGKAVGMTASVSYAETDGWEWIKFIVWDSEAAEHCANGDFAVSCSYYPTLDVTPGVWHNMPYDARVIGGEYEHLAIVQNPRYEDSRILRNSKGGSAMSVKDTVKKFLMKFTNAGVDNSVEVNEAAKFDINGEKVTLGQLMVAHNAMEEAKAEAEALKNATDESTVTLSNGQTVTIGQLKASFTAFKNATPAKAVNEAHEGKETPKEEAEEEKARKEAAKNAEDEAKKKEDEEAEAKKKAENEAKAKAQNALDNAAEKRGANTVFNSAPITQSDRLALGSKV